MASYHTYSDEYLVSLIQSSDRVAFAEIYERYWKKLFITATNRLGSPQEAEDLVQDLMLKLWRNRQELSLRSPLGNYFAAALKYEVINRLAKQKRQTGYKMFTNIIEADRSTEHSLEFSALEKRLSLLVNALPKQCRMVFTLSREQGLSQKKIAEVMEISENTVESHMKKAIKTLRASLRQFLLFFL